MYITDSLDSSHSTVFNKTSKFVEIQQLGQWHWKQAVNDTVPKYIYATRAKNYFKFRNV